MVLCFKLDASLKATYLLIYITKQCKDRAERQEESRINAQAVLLSWLLFVLSGLPHFKYRTAALLDFFNLRVNFFALANSGHKMCKKLIITGTGFVLQRKKRMTSGIAGVHIIFCFSRCIFLLQSVSRKGSEGLRFILSRCKYFFVLSQSEQCGT